jgi:thiamine kinase-like enzyme
MTRAMNINIKRGGDDLFKNRLFSYLSKELAVKIHDIKQLRGNVYIVRADDYQCILKGYKDLRKLKIQEAFTSSLRKSGFEHSYCFYQNSNPPLYFQKEYYGCLEYIQPNDIPFHYAHESDRHEGINLLREFHDKTVNLASSYTTLLPKADLANKWHQRKIEFTKNLPQLNYFVSKAMTREFISWADFSLRGFSNLKNKLDTKEKVILHGDVAYHNFLRSKEGKLYLIDYDLISTGPSAYDMLQYANRILPFLDWKLSALAEVNHLNDWLNNNAFLYGLLYPADLLREWNRLIRDGQNTNPYRTAPIVEMTISQFQQRLHFQEEIKILLGC